MYRTICSCDFDLWPMTLKFNRAFAVINIHVHAKFHQAKCDSRVITVTEKQTNRKLSNDAENSRPTFVATVDSNNVTKHLQQTCHAMCWYVCGHPSVQCPLHTSVPVQCNTPGLLRARACNGDASLVTTRALVRTSRGLEIRLEIWGKAQRESAWRPKSDWGKLWGGGKIFSAPKSRGPNSNALAYAECALST